MTRKLGKKPAKIDPRTLVLAKYFTDTLAAPPAECRLDQRYYRLGHDA